VSDGYAALDAMIAKLRALGDRRAVERAAELAAPAVLAEVQKTAAAGTTPEGRAWKPKVDGGRALVHAASHITAAARGRVVDVVLRGVDVFHHKGLGGKPRRQILPDAVSVPPAIWRAVRRACHLAFRETVGR
jgi:hypothetical protein